MKKYSPPAQRYYRTKGMRHYEITNHLGNVMATISDRKLGQSPDNDTLINYYHADLLSAKDYYPGGMLMPGRAYSPDNYRFGFNGKENDNEVKGTGNSLDFGARIYDPRGVRFLSLDPLSFLMPWQSPYNFVSNNPILRIDQDGRWDIEVHAFNQRGTFGYAVLIAKDRNGNEIYRTIVRVQGTSHSANGYDPRDRTKTYADTPTGTYDMTNWENKAGTVSGRKSYGPNDALRLVGMSGEIESSNRDGILGHGGRQETYDEKTKTWSENEDPVLKPTYGCIRFFDESIEQLQSTTNTLMVNDPLESMGNLTLSNDLIFDISSNKYFTPSDYTDLTTARTNLYYSSDFIGACEKLQATESKGINLQSVTQPTTDDTETN